MFRLNHLRPIFILAVTLVAAARPGVGQSGPPPGYNWIENPGNGHFYALTAPMDWIEAEAEARSVGVHLATVRDLSEQDWITLTFPPVAEGYWIGYHSQSGLGNWEWSSGEVTPFWAANGFVGKNGIAGYWASGEPNQSVSNPDELFCHIRGYYGGKWNDRFLFDTPGLLEWISPPSTDIDNDGISNDDELSITLTDPNRFDSDGDGLGDGMEIGLTVGTPDTDPNIFIPDADPATTTDPLLADSDGGGVDDGIEDQSRDGRVDTWETDPNLQADEALAFYVSELKPGQRVHFEVFNATPFQNVIPAYSTRGPGPTPTSLGLSLDLSMPITALNAYLSNQDGRISANGPRVPGGLALGIPIWLQAVEIPISSTLAPRASNALMLPVGAN